MCEVLMFAESLIYKKTVPLNKTITPSSLCHTFYRKSNTTGLRKRTIASAMLSTNTGF